MSGGGKAGDRYLLLARPLPRTAGGGWLAVDLRGGAATFHLTDLDRTPDGAPGALLAAGPGDGFRALPGGGLLLAEGLLWSFADPCGAGRDPEPLPTDEIAAATSLRAERARWLAGWRRWHDRPQATREACRRLLALDGTDLTLLLDMLDAPPPFASAEEAAAASDDSTVPPSTDLPGLPAEMVTWMTAQDGFGALYGEGFTPRGEQADMTGAVAEALLYGQAALVEAGTGVGKTLAYLVPLVAAARAGRRVVVATHTRALQNQILEQDLPRLGPVLGDLRAALLMGRRNYLCLRQRRSYLGRPREGLADSLRGAAFRLWLEDTSHGLREELTDHPLLSVDVPELFDTPEPCLPGACYEGDACCVQTARRRARESDLVVVNHSLLMHDLAQSGGLIGDHDHLVVDEAHRLPAVALETHGVVCGLKRIDDLEHLVGRLAKGDRQPERVALAVSRLATIGDGDEPAVAACGDFGQALRRVATAFTAWWRALGAAVDGEIPGSGRPRGRQRVRDKDMAFAPVRGETAALLDALDEGDRTFARLADASAKLEDPGRALQDDLAVLGQAGQLLRLLHHDVRFLATRPAEEWVTWLEAGRRQGLRLLGATRLEAGELLREYWQGTGQAPVMTSATLAVGADFGHMLGELGLTRRHPATVTVSFPSPFDMHVQSLSLVPKHFPALDASDRDSTVGEVIRDLVQATGRKTMGLFTSYRALGTAAEVLAAAGLDENGGHGPALLVQQEGGSPGALARRFRRLDRAVLLGTSTFWEGVDFPGADLEVLVVAKLPFLVPNDPWVDARCERLQAAGENPFKSFMVRDAVLRLRQGCGRLIRRTSDRGVVVVLDPRLHTRNYGATFLGALPAMPLTFGDTAELLERVDAFFRGAGHANRPENS